MKNVPCKRIYVLVRNTTSKMLGGVWIVTAFIAIFMILESFFPRKRLIGIHNWKIAAISVNLFQLFVAIIFYVLEDYLKMPSRLDLKSKMGPISSGLLAYFFHTWLMYWWHYLRHVYRPLWCLLHQFHHAPQRIETLTSFFKHPFEMIINSFLMVVMVYPIMGLSGEASMILSVLAGLGEFIYHVNVPLPKCIDFISYIFQTTREHIVHHEEYIVEKSHNYSDLLFPWDILNGTFKRGEDNDKIQPPTGIGSKSNNFWDILMCKDILRKKNFLESVTPSFDDMIVMIATIIAFGSIIGYIFFMPKVQAISFATAASPLPLVFSVYNGVETFTFNYTDIIINNSSHLDVNDVYNHIEGPYNYRNVIGAMFAYGPLFEKDTKMYELRQIILKWAICRKNICKNWDLVPQILHNITIDIKSKTRGFENHSWQIYIDCDY